MLGTELRPFRPVMKNYSNRGVLAPGGEQPSAENLNSTPRQVCDGGHLLFMTLVTISPSFVVEFPLRNTYFLPTTKDASWNIACGSVGREAINSQ